MRIERVEQVGTNVIRSVTVHHYLCRITITGKSVELEEVDGHGHRVSFREMTILEFLSALRGDRATNDGAEASLT